MGLGSGRRVMKSPPLLLAVLLACVFVLGINYWITSTRCVELQSRVLELEGRIRRAAAERGAVEMKKNEFEDMLSKQKDQIDNIKSLHSSQMQHVEQLWNIEKERLLSNITAQDSLVQNLQAEIANYQKQVEESKLQLKDLQESQAKKLSYELAQCSNKIAEVKEQCEEKIRRLTAKDANVENEEEVKNIVTNIEKTKPVTPKLEINQKAINSKEEQQVKDVSLTDEKPSETQTQKEGEAPPENKEQNKVPAADEKKPSPSPQEPKMKGEKNPDEEEQVPNEVNPNLANADEEDDEPKAEDVEDAEKGNENEEVERENLLNMDGPPEDEKDAKLQNKEEKLNYYNGYDGNEAESEKDKQLQLGANDPSVKGGKVENDMNEPAEKQPEKEDNPRLK